jgi:hypothetical protein
MSEQDDQQRPRIPIEWRRAYLMRPLEKLPQDVTYAFDQLHQQRRETNTMNRALIETKRKLGIADVKVWVLMLVVTGEGVVIGWLAKIVLAHLAK